MMLDVIVPQVIKFDVGMLNDPNLAQVSANASRQMGWPTIFVVVIHVHKCSSVFGRVKTEDCIGEVTFAEYIMRHLSHPHEFYQTIVEFASDGIDLRFANRRVYDLAPQQSNAHSVGKSVQTVPVIAVQQSVSVDNSFYTLDQLKLRFPFREVNLQLTFSHPSQLGTGRQPAKGCSEYICVIVIGVGNDRLVREHVHAMDREEFVFGHRYCAEGGYAGQARCLTWFSEELRGIKHELGDVLLVFCIIGSGLFVRLAAANHASPCHCAEGYKCDWQSAKRRQGRDHLSPTSELWLTKNPCRSKYRRDKGEYRCKNGEKVPFGFGNFRPDRGGVLFVSHKFFFPHKQDFNNSYHYSRQLKSPSSAISTVIWGGPMTSDMPSLFDTLEAAE